MELERLTTETQEPETVEKPESSGFFRKLSGYCLNFLYDYSWVMLLAATILIVAYYVWFPSRAHFHSDTTDTLMWAQATYDAGELFNKDFSYACLLPFSTSLIMTALIPLFGVSMTTHVLGMLIFFLLFTAALIWLLRGLGWSWKWVSFGVFTELMLLSGSEKLREIFWGHTIYYSIGVLFLFVGLGMLFRWMDADGQPASPKNKRRLPLLNILLGIWFVLTCMNQLNSMTIFALPVMAAVFLERFLDAKTPLCSRKNCGTLCLLVIMGAGMILGYYLTVVLSDGIHASYAEAHSTFSSMSEWIFHLEKFPEHWFSLLGVTAEDNDPLLSAKSIVNLLMIVVSLVLLILPLVGLCNYSRIEDGKLRLLILTYWCMTALIMLGYVCGMLSSANWRLSPIMAMAALVSAAVVHWAVGRVQLQRVAAVMMIPVVIVCTMNALTILKMPANGYKDAELYRLADALKERGLDYGYATFWQANALTVISDSEVKCRNVTIDEDGIRPYVYQSNENWFNDQPGQEKYFLLLTKEEHTQLRVSGDPILNLAHVESELFDFCLWVFQENIFEEEKEELPEDLEETIRAGRGE